MGKNRDTLKKEDVDSVIALVEQAILFAGSIDNLASIIGVSRISVWAWRNNQYLPRGSHMMGLMSYCEKQKRKKSA
jgi:hypothetical protein